MTSPLLFLMTTTALAQVAGGTLVVSVPNAPGEIMLDGFPTGQEAPATLENVAPGTHLVQMEFGCMVGEKEVTVEADGTTELTLPMQYKGGTGTIRLKGVPYTATVLVDDAPAKSWDEGLEAKCGSRRLAIEAPGFEDWTAEVIITSGKWITLPVSLVESEIQESAPAPRPSSRPVDDFDDEDDYELDELDQAYADDSDDSDDFDEPSSSSSSSSSRDKDRERELERRQQEQAERQRADEDGRRAAEDERRRVEDESRRAEEDERKSRYGDIDSLDGEEDEGGEESDDRRRSSRDELEEEGFDEDEPARRSYDEDEDEYDDEFDDEFDDEDSDRFEDSDDYDDYDELDEFDEGGSSRESREAKEPREPRAPRESGGGNPKVLQYGGTGAGAVVAVGGAAVAIVSGIQYSAGRANWGIIVDATGLGSEQEISYWDQYVQPYRRNLVIGAVIAGVGLAAGGTWFFVAPDGTVHVGMTRQF